MKIIIEGSRSLQDVQHEFNMLYPFLKIEFFRPHNGITVTAAASNMLKHSLKISEARRVQHNGTIEVDDFTKVSELENEFRNKYGLNIQVFRKSGNVWLETTMSDNWTLYRQNEHAKEIATFVNEKPIRNIDQ